MNNIIENSENEDKKIEDITARKIYMDMYNNTISFENLDINIQTKEGEMNFSENVKTMNELANIIERFKVFNGLKEGDKIWISKNEKGVVTFAIDDSYVPSFSRWWANQDRDQLLNQISEDNNTITHNIQFITTSNTYNSLKRQVLATHMNSCIKGLETMKNIYGDTHNDQLIELIANMQEMHKRINDSIEYH